MTLPRAFLSYRRSRAAEAELLVAAMHDVGIPTWRDVSDLRERPTSDALLEVLAGDSISEGLLWLTPEVADSPTMLRIEIPALLARARRDPAFSLIPVLAGGLEYKDLGPLLEDARTLEDLGLWNVPPVLSNPLSEADAAGVAERVLQRRLEALHRHLPAGQPLHLALDTRETGSAPLPETALHLDWTARFSGHEAHPGAWDAHLLPALRTVRAVIGRRAPRRAVVASGSTVLPAALALGAAFVLPGGIDLAWEQLDPTTGARSPWTNHAPLEPHGFVLERTEKNPAAHDLAVLVSISDSVDAPFTTSRRSLPPWRAQIQVTKADGIRHRLTAGSAVALANDLELALRAARQDCAPIHTVHLFLSAPAGFAVLLGQRLNTFDAVQTYEYLGETKGYVPAALLQPSS